MSAPRFQELIPWQLVLYTIVCNTIVCNTVGIVSRIRGPSIPPYGRVSASSGTIIISCDVEESCCEVMLIPDDNKCHIDLCSWSPIMDAKDVQGWNSVQCSSYKYMWNEWATIT